MGAVPGSVIPFALAAAAILALRGGRKSAGGGAEPGKPLGGGLANVYAWGLWVEATGAIPGFANFATGAAKTESNGNNLVGLGVSRGILPGNVKLNDHLNASQKEADAACNLWEGARTRGFYLENPYDWRYWCFGSGGWFGLLPATGLSAGGTKGPFAEQSPFLVFDPIPSVVMIADFAKRVIRSQRFQGMPYGEQNWLAVRRGMAASSLIGDYTETKNSSRKVREHFENALAKVGIDPDFMFTRAEVGDWMGATRLLNWLYENAAQAA